MTWLPHPKRNVSTLSIGKIPIFQKVISFRVNNSCCEVSQNLGVIFTQFCEKSRRKISYRSDIFVCLLCSATRGGGLKIVIRTPDINSAPVGGLPGFDTPLVEIKQKKYLVDSKLEKRCVCENHGRFFLIGFLIAPNFKAR